MTISLSRISMPSDEAVCDALESTQLSPGQIVALGGTYSVLFGIALSFAAYAALATFIWGWLAAILALIASYYIGRLEPVRAVKRHGIIALCRGIAALRAKPEAEPEVAA